MTIEEKAKAYDEALERARKIHNEILNNELLGFPEQIREIFPQLRESEDERIRRTLVEYFGPKVQLDFVRGVPIQKIRDWLEKQKPMYNLEIPAGDVAPAEEDGPFDEDEFLEGELSAFLQNYDKEYDDDAAVSDVARHFYEIGKKQKEQNKCPEFCSGHCVGCERNEQRDYRKLYEDIVKSKWFKQNYVGKSLGCDEEPTDAKSERVIKAARSVLNNWLDGTDCPDVSSDFTELEYAIREYDGEEKAKEQKPAEYLSKDKVYAIMNKLTNLSYSSLIPLESEEYVKIQEITSDVCSLLDYPIEQKPAEWDEFDKGALKDAICAADILGNDESFNKGNPNLAKAFRVAKDWLKSLPERLNLQPKQEWSEEDEKMLRTIISDGSRGVELDSKQISWLKSLPMRCPKSSDNWKPSEDEERLINTSISFLKDFADKGYENAVECIDWLKSKLNGNTCK